MTNFSSIPAFFQRTPTPPPRHLRRTKLLCLPGFYGFQVDPFNDKNQVCMEMRKTNVDVWSEGFFNHPSRKRTFLFSGLKIPLETHFLQEMFQPIWAVKVTRYQCWPRYESIPMGVSNLAGTGVWWPYLAAMCDVTGKGKNGTRKYPPNLLFSGKKNTLDDSGPLPKCAQKKIATHFGHKKITARFFLSTAMVSAWCLIDFPVSPKQS